ncbi:glycosyltransferase involved in cell wall biosynthesis [Algoriphagus sp. 4150]|uniref:glycosyltransferase family 4 protein n=1 Tax=Algoriphagus sp. 4150 TaxID=2817756 RepID=UPI0028669C47|nr:glycosyltransferase family 1 protein [Algoriphagus sp. 4150]MDR7131764.1 glycosyltransferase involved in cell wall biosynthesis [Algoriphagus sp. 4150]
MKNICIDLTNIVPGKGGAGGGIATYGRELILGIDELLGNSEDLRSEYKVTVLLNTDTYKNLPLQNLNRHYFAVNNQNLFARMYWLHVRLPRFLKQQKMDLLHRILSEMPIRKVCNYAVTVHDFMFEFYLSRPEYVKYLGTKERLKFRLLNGLLSKSVETSDLVIANSQSTGNDVKSRFPESHSKVESVLLGYSQSSFSPPMNQEGKSDQIIRFGVVAAFHPHKGHLSVIKLAERIVALGFVNSFHFYFRGSPVYQEYYDEIKEAISQRNLTDYFTFESYDPEITLADIYNSYTATVLLSNYEGFGLPVIESQAYSRPVICSKIPVFEEILGDSAIFLDKDPSDGELMGLMADLKDVELMESLKEKGRLNAANYTWSSTCKHTMEAYSKLLD